MCVCVCVCMYVCVCVCVHEFVGRSVYVTCTVCGVLCGSIVWEGNWACNFAFLRVRYMSVCIWILWSSVYVLCGVVCVNVCTIQYVWRLCKGMCVVCVRIRVYVFKSVTLSFSHIRYANFCHIWHPLLDYLCMRHYVVLSYWGECCFSCLAFNGIELSPKSTCSMSVWVRGLCVLYCGLYSGHIVHYFMIYDTCHLLFLTCQGDGDSTSDNEEHGSCLWRHGFHWAMDNCVWVWCAFIMATTILLVYSECTYDDVAHTYLRRARNLRDEEDCSL